MLRALTCVVIGVLGGCGDNGDGTVTADVACHEQADIYCSHGGDSSDACIDSYLQQCGASPTRRIDARAQDQCLADLEVVTACPRLPRSCGELFEVPLLEVCTAPSP